MIGKLNNKPLLNRLVHDLDSVPSLEEIVILYGESCGFRRYEEAMRATDKLPDRLLIAQQQQVNCYETCMLLFTSGSTGNPKAASLTHLSVQIQKSLRHYTADDLHSNVLNNARFIGDRLRFTPHDVLCCPPPLFHCFGLVLGLLAILTHGGKIIYPGEVFDPQATMRAIAEEQCTGLHGVPAMFDTLFSLPRLSPSTSRLRTGIIAGAPVPKQLMVRMFNEFGMKEFTSSYGKNYQIKFEHDAEQQVCRSYRSISHLLQCFRR